MLYRMLVLLLIVTGIPVMAVAADTLNKEVDGIDQASEQQRLDGYGWTLLLNDDSDYLYSPVSHSLDTRMQLMAFNHWNEIEMGGGRSTLWSDSELGLVNAIASYLDYNSGHYYRFGAEGKYYYGSLTASGRAGYLQSTGQPGYFYDSNAFESQPFAGFDLRWYATDNLSFQIGGEQINDVTTGKIRLEYQPSFDNVSGLSFFARASHGNEDNEYVLGGVRYSFGQGLNDAPSLLMRDRSNPYATGADQLSPEFRSLY